MNVWKNRRMWRGALKYPEDLAALSQSKTPENVRFMKTSREKEDSNDCVKSGGVWRQPYSSSGIHGFQLLSICRRHWTWHLLLYSFSVISRTFGSDLELYFDYLIHFYLVVVGPFPGKISAPWSRASSRPSSLLPRRLSPSSTLCYTFLSCRLNLTKETPNKMNTIALRKVGLSIYVKVVFLNSSFSRE